MTTSSKYFYGGLAAFLCLATAQLALAHPGHSTDNSWAAGATHPIFGWDHLLAMAASGLLAVRIGTRKALWLVPLSFVALMLAGGLLAWLGMPLPNVEWGVSASVIILGLAVAMLPKAPLNVSVALVGAFALLHGHAHVAELNGHAVLPYMAGFACATLALHAAAIGAGLTAKSLGGQRIVRLAGAAIAAAFGVMLLTGSVN